MLVLSDAELVQSKRIRQWTFYKRNEAQIKKIKRQFSAEL